MTQQCVLIDGSSLTVELLDEIVGKDRKIGLTEGAWQKVKKSRDTIDHMIADPNKVVYGITTGFGSFANVSIDHQSRRQLQINLIRSHAVGVGRPIPVDISKRLLILRINTLSKGRSGIRPQNMRKMIEACNKNFISRIPCQGTVGASGDLAPLSHQAIALMGQGEAYDFQTKSYRPSNEILSKLGLEKIQLAQKQGLALINGTQFMSSILSSAISKIQTLIQSSIALYAIATQIFGLDRNLFTKQSEDFYSEFNPELAEVIRQIRNLIGNEESELHRQRATQEEVHSLLDYPQALAGVIKMVRMAKGMVEEQMNSATDNPLVYWKQEGIQQDSLISAGNFHGEYVAKAADFLGFALFDLGRFSDARIQRYINSKISRLPHFLVKQGGLNNGMMIPQYTTAALLSESKVLVKPASVDSIVTSAGQEDHVSMGGFAARKCQMLVHNMSHILGIQLLNCATALNILEVKSSEKLNNILQSVNKTVPPILLDRYFAPDIEEATRLVRKNLQMI